MKCVHAAALFTIAQRVDGGENDYTVDCYYCDAIGRITTTDPSSFDPQAVQWSRGPELLSAENIRGLLQRVVAQNEDPKTGDRDLLEESRAMLGALACRNELFEVDEVAVLSTAHMPSTYPDFGDLHFDEYDEGFFVYVSTPDGLAGFNVPAWISPIVTACHDHNIRRLQFDSAGARSTHFTTYEW